jgi:glycosyltransferase involved in cell wall biosynthesis
MAAHADVDALPPGAAVEPAAYDAIVYTVGNSHHHVPTVRQALRCPGVVWFHDARLPGLGEEVGADLVRAARAVVVNSRAAEGMLRAGRGPEDLPPLLRLEHAVPDPPAGGPAGRAANPPLVATFGVVHPLKAPGRLMEAVARIVPAARLAIVGSLEHVHREELEARAGSLGIADRVEIHGRVDEKRWWELMREAKVAVQLRRATHGEASGAIASAQAVGTPVVTNIAAAEEEYPADAVLAIDADLRPGALERALTRLLEDGAESERYSAGALRHARRCTFPHVAGRLVEFLEDPGGYTRASAGPARAAG